MTSETGWHELLWTRLDESAAGHVRNNAAYCFQFNGNN